MSDKPKCPVFGCTIPRGIPHEHPAGVSALDDLAMRNLEDSAGDISPETYQALHNALEISRTQYSPMLPGRKLRDALLVAGIADADAGRTKPLSEVRARYAENKETASVVVNELSDAAFDELLAKKRAELGVTVDEWTEVRRLSVVQIAGRIATGIVLAIGVVSILILSAMTAGWL